LFGGSVQMHAGNALCNIHAEQGSPKSGSRRISSGPRRVNIKKI